MMRKLTLLLCLLLLSSLSLFLGVGCDDLTTEVNNNTVFDSTLGEDCLRCHSDDDNVIVQPKGQWANSEHASPDLIEAHVTLNGDPFETNACGPQCHSSEGFIRFTKDGLTPAQPMPSVINCFTCHMPHTGNYGSWKVDTLRGLVAPVLLRGNIDYNMGESNMCVHCHQATKVPVIAAGATAVRLDTLFGPDGPHYSPQAHVLIGAGGFRFTTTNVISSHAAVASQGGCLKCHFGTGIGYEFGEHTFRLHNEATGGEYLANCLGSGCHSTTGGLLLAGLFNNDIQDTIRALSDSLARLLLSDNILTGTDEDTTEYHGDSLVTPDEAKILYNYLLYKKDGSQAVHNPDYIQTLLQESITRWSSVPQAAFTIDDDSGCVPHTITLTNLSTGAITGYTWVFTSADTSFDQNPGTFQFTSPGVYPVKLVVNDELGTSDEVVIPVTVGAPPLVDSIIVEPDTLVAGGTVTFKGYAVGQTTSVWDFGDGIGSEAADSAQYIYPAAGEFWAKYTAVNGCGFDVDSLKVVVTAPPPGAPKRNLSRR